MNRLWTYPSLLSLALACWPVAGHAAPPDRGPRGNTPAFDSNLGGVIMRLQERARAEELRRLARGVPRELTPIAANASVQVVDVASTLSFDVPGQAIVSDGTLTVKANAPGVSSLYLYVMPVSADPVFADAEGPLSLTLEQWGLYRLTLRKPLGVGEQVQLSFSQTGQPQCSQQGSSFGMVYCMISPGHIYDLGGAWQPSVYDLTSYQLVSPQKASLALTVPGTMTAAATGIGAGVTDNADGTRTFSFVNEWEQGFSFSAAPYVAATTAFAGDKTAGTFLLAANAADGEAWRKAIADVIAFHAERYGPYDPPKIDMAEVPDQVGAAVGPMLTVFLPTSSLAYRPHHWSGTTTLAHELAHQWFGGLIRIEEQISPWLNEGFASFAEALFTSSRASAEIQQDYARLIRYMSALQYFYLIPPTHDVPISSPQIHQIDMTIYYYLTYVKGAMVPSMLHYLVGEQQYFAALKAYRAACGAGTSVKCLADAFQQSTGKDISAFLTRWAHQTGFPTIAVDVQRSAGAPGATVVATADKPFWLPLELDVSTADGKTERVRLEPDATGTRYEHALSSAAELVKVRCDPDWQILGRSRGALPGDVRVDGEVDGVDLIWTAAVVGEVFDPYSQRNQAAMSFPEWADLAIDSRIDQKDLDIVVGSFGKRSGE